MKKQLLGGALLGVVGVLACLFFVRPAQAATSTQSIAFPMYEYPGVNTLWQDVNGAGSQVPFLIVNPGSGPGTSVDPTYTSYINGNTTAGQRSIGYVHTNYHARPIADVLEDIDTFSSFYPGISGNFLDLIKSGTPDDTCYVATLHNYIKSRHPNYLVVMNPGVNVPATFEPYSDIFMNAENFYSAYASWTPNTDGFENNSSYANRFWHAIHTVSSGQMAAALALTRTNNAGWVLLTNATMPNPYNVTPSYWSTFLSSVASLPQSTIPNRGLTQLPSGCLDVSANIAFNPTSAIVVNMKNADTARTLWGPSKVTFTLPAGVAMKTAGGTGWTCTGATCTYSDPLAANTFAPTLTADVSIACPYASGNIDVAIQNFAGNTVSTSGYLAGPTDTCPVVPTTGSSTPPPAAPKPKARQVAVDAELPATPVVDAPRQETTISTADVPRDTTIRPTEAEVDATEKQQTETGINAGLMWTLGVLLFVGVAVVGVAVWRRGRRSVI
ncbi:MAG TPA: spherulation-specific family 4 protein [Candidatus Saccharimonadales bacterium]|nr:spherulation-specific family 4 protein [Candidatus Saccharimonadales bacterium]